MPDIEKLLNFFQCNGTACFTMELPIGTTLKLDHSKRIQRMKEFADALRRGDPG